MSTIVVTCEHGGNAIPKEYRSLFSSCERLLESHRGFDSGALPVARALARHFHAPLIAARISRLLVDLNRSETHPRVFSEITRGLPESRREAILSRHYRPHRAEVLTTVRAASTHDCVLHLAIHSFTPKLAGEVRRADLGLLYDPSRASERTFAGRLSKAIRASTDLIVRKNYPYRGASDGLTTALRRQFSARRYIGLEIEMNQRFAPAPHRRRIVAALVRALELVLAEGAPRARRFG